MGDRDCLSSSSWLSPGCGGATGAPAAAAVPAPPISGERIIEVFQIEPSKVIGDIKTEIKEAILEGKIKNNEKEAHQLMLELGKKKGLVPNEKFISDK